MCRPRQTCWISIRNTGAGWRMRGCRRDPSVITGGELLLAGVALQLLHAVAVLFGRANVPVEADGTLTLVGRHALALWCWTAEEPASPAPGPDAPPA